MMEALARSRIEMPPCGEAVGSSSIELKALNPDSFDEWDAFVWSSDHGTFCHSVAWKRAIEKAWGHRSIYLMALRNGRVTGILPMFVVRSIFGRMLVSCPNAVYGGAVASDEDSGTALLSRAAAIAVEERVQYLDLRNWHEAQSVPVSPRLHRSGLYVAFDQAISPDEDALMRGFPRDTRRMIRLGPKNGLSAEIGGEELLDPFCDVYAYSLRSLGTPVFPKRLFRAFLQAFSGQCKILVVRHGGQVASAVLSFFYKDTVAPYYAGAYPQFYKSGVNYFMYWELMRAAAADGYTRFDFGRSKRETGAYAFKKGWGMNHRPLPYASLPVRARTVPNLTPTNSKFRLAIRAWQHLPLQLTKAIGPLIVRHLP